MILECTTVALKSSSTTPMVMTTASEWISKSLTSARELVTGSNTRERCTAILAVVTAAGQGLIDNR
jgi:hypothetical protein